jgi:hypothetical protein
MIYRIGSQALDVPEMGEARKARTPRQVVPWRDVAETCRTLDAVCGQIRLDKNFPKMLDGIARAGFWGAVFRERWPGCRLHLNEEDEGCLPILKRNFPHKAEFSSYSIHEWTPPRADVSLLDFDHFTLRILDQWADVLQRFSPQARYFIIADGACFGFKFGNLKHYGVDDEKDYYHLLNEAIRPLTNKHITVVSRFCNASTILLEDAPRENGITFLEPSDLFLSRGGKPYKQKKIKNCPKGFGI